jgi:iron-sulfur cluster assembly protein
MITITPNAAKQIRKASEQADAEDMYLRLAAKREDGGDIEYGMGFDDMGGQDQIYQDQIYTSEGIDVLISDSCKDLLSGATLDYVEISAGKYEFIFVNPNDTRHQAPKPEQAG